MAAELGVARISQRMRVDERLAARPAGGAAIPLNRPPVRLGLQPNEVKKKYTQLLIALNVVNTLLISAPCLNCKPTNLCLMIALP